ncbi:hypothetical protein NPS01_28770 [Nocardioides psychrotolerans]|uniref:hypothetical protein n=1 Tax=Nocardioides psychrotolerans TaxID=1005945 RepID=UPI0011981A10|nr:hypothetical protein [Nocardioides psychrotolerans]GEP39214.1 hypothetical protein NPS01_28770 [Nocardioides psychrotolerans]
MVASRSTSTTGSPQETCDPRDVVVLGLEIDHLAVQRSPLDLDPVTLDVDGHDVAVELVLDDPVLAVPRR